MSGEGQRSRRLVAKTSILEPGTKLCLIQIVDSTPSTDKASCKSRFTMVDTSLIAVYLHVVGNKTAVHFNETGSYQPPDFMLERNNFSFSYRVFCKLGPI